METDQGRSCLVQDAAKGGVSGLAGKLPQKRSRDPEVVKEKEKARNRCTLLPPFLWVA